MGGKWRGWKGEEPKRKGWEEWESASMTMTEWASEGVWMKGWQKGMNPCGTQKERHCHLSHCAPVSLTLSAFRIFILLFHIYLFFLNLHLLISSLFCATSLPQLLLVLPSPISSAPRFPLLSFIPTSTPNIKTSKFEEPSFLLLSLTLK